MNHHRIGIGLAAGWLGLARMLASQTVTEFPIPGSGGPGGLRAIAAGSDGNLWFTEVDAYYNNKIGRITTAGVLTEFLIPTPGNVRNPPRGIAAGPDGNLWFTEFAARQIGRITTAGVITEFAIVAPGCYDIGNTGVCSARPYRIAAAPDGNLWFTIAHADRNGRMTASSIGRINTGAACVANDTTLCLSASRFMVTADYETQEGQSGAAHAVTLTSNTGYFWFFDPTNVEVVTKILPYCADPFNSIWIFAAGLTDVKVDLTYTDTSNDTVATKKNELGVPFAPVQDTSAFTTCP